MSTLFGDYDPTKTKDRVIINCGGIRHECYISTIQNFPDTRLYWIAETALKMADFDPDGNEFFFDRHPQCFSNILNYCRTGKLHCPNDVCGPLFEQELAFWGVDELMMEPCCWGGYTQHRNAHKNLSMFDEMRENEMGEDDDEDDDDDYGIDLQSRYKNHVDIKPIDNTKGKSKCWNKWLCFRPKLWSILEKPFSSFYAQVSAFISMMVILVSLATFCAETVQYFKGYYKIFNYLEYFYCAFFTLELLLRLCCCPSMKKYFLSLMTWIDIISTLQFYISFITETKSLDFLFVSRLLRIFRLFRFFKNLSGMQVIAQTLKASANELLLLCIILLIPMIIFSTLVFYADSKEPKSHFSSIPGTFWWTIITMTTVGYGDVTPTSLVGKLIGALCACSGVLIVALPVSVIGSNFNLYYSYAQARMKLPKRKSPALVSADKSLVTGNNNKYNNGDAIKNSLKGFASVMIDLTSMHPKSPTRSPSPSPLKRERSLTRRHAIHVEPTVNNSTLVKKTTDKKKQRKSRVLSEVKIYEELTPSQSDNCEKSNDTSSDFEYLHCDNNSNNNNNNNNKCSVQGFRCVEDGGNDNGTVNIETTIYTNSHKRIVNGTHKDETDGGNINENNDNRNTFSPFPRDPGGNSLEILQPNARQRSTSAPFHRRLTNSSLQDYIPPVSPINIHRKKTVIHIDLTQYKPKRIGKSEQKARHRRLTHVPTCHSDGPAINMLLRGNSEVHNLQQQEGGGEQAPWMRAAENALNQEQDTPLLFVER